ncbi:MAG: hypothetical protein A2176_07505 [Spirochaetes bacterium RBG_13_51_14]|nr:MAG: hypothetical protein A2176_07505 [Spirochaetes bacterium RBG_13_51_14]
MRLIKEMFTIVVAASIIGFGINLFNHHGFLLVGGRDLKYKKIVPISSFEAKIKYDAGIALFIDAREKSEYDDARITGAINIPPFSQFGPDAADEPSGGNRDGAGADTSPDPGTGVDVSFMSRPVEIIIYCERSSCGASEMVGRRLIDRGYVRNIYIIDKGFPEWKSLGYPVERGE